MFVTMNRIFVHEDHWEAFEERFRKRSGLVDQSPGFVRNMILRPENPEDPHIVMTLWESKAAFEAWTQSGSFVRAHAGARNIPEGMFRDKSRLEMFETVLDTEAD